jgi:hypothetical protein
MDSVHYRYPPAVVDNKEIAQPVPNDLLNRYHIISKSKTIEEEGVYCGLLN